MILDWGRFREGRMYQMRNRSRRKRRKRVITRRIGGSGGIRYSKRRGGRTSFIGCRRYCLAASYFVAMSSMMPDCGKAGREQWRESMLGGTEMMFV